MSDSTSIEIKIPRRRSSHTKCDDPVYEIDVWVRHSAPPIWRALLVPSTMTLEMLHGVIQCALNWDGDHLHQFETADGRRYEPDFQIDNSFAELFGGTPSRPEHNITLRSLFEALKTQLIYWYDFGDDWYHGIRLVNTHADAAALAPLPRCLDGRRRGPLEDCGGIRRYESLVEQHRARKANEHAAGQKDDEQKGEQRDEQDDDDDWDDDDDETLLDWIDEDFDPDAFDIEAINRRLAGVRPRLARGPSAAAVTKSQRNRNARRSKRKPGKRRSGRSR